jgi:hypothetical protein
MQNSADSAVLLLPLVFPLQTSQAECEENLAASVKSLAFGMAGGPQEEGDLAAGDPWSLGAGEPGAEQYEQYYDQEGQYYDEGGCQLLQPIVKIARSLALLLGRGLAAYLLQRSGTCSGPSCLAQRASRVCALDGSAGGVASSAACRARRPVL